MTLIAPQKKPQTPKKPASKPKSKTIEVKKRDIGYGKARGRAK